MLDRWREIFEVLWRRKLRTLLTALSVSWGIFMLVVLLGAGNGLRSGANAEFARDATNSVWMEAGRLSKPHQGSPIGRRVRFRERDYQLLGKTVPIVEDSSARIGPGTETVRRRDRSGAFQVRGVHPGHERIEATNIVSGRYLNAIDIEEKRKVAVIGKRVVEALFPRGAEPLGEEIDLGAAVFVVVGTFEEKDEEREEQTIYVPFSTAQLVWGANQRLENIMFTVGDASTDETKAAVEELRFALAARHGFAPDDKRAVWIWNNQEMFQRFQGLFRGIATFIWIIGLGTIAAGVVGVSNIMLISVQERTREIGVRKAIGARPSAIVLMVVEEALVVTLASGYLGLVAGVGALVAAQKVLPPTPFFRNPDVDFGAALGATAVLVVAGVLAGLFPALRAARVNPIQALRTE